ncbi:MAG: aminotransferase class III-fold pyridoxal phosphate-dependent enzyme, partial [Myxococcales bacterium]
MSPIDTTHLLAPTPRPDVVMTRGEGSWLYDETGNRYLDFVQGWAVNCLGHSSDVIRKSLVHQADQL